MDHPFFSSAPGRNFAFDATASHRYDLIPLNESDQSQVEMANMPFDARYNRYIHDALSMYVDQFGLLFGGIEDILIIPPKQEEYWLFFDSTDVDAKLRRHENPVTNLYANVWDPDSVPEFDSDFERKRKAEVTWPMLAVTIPNLEWPHPAIPRSLRFAMRNIVEKLQALTTAGGILQRVPNSEFQEVLAAVQKFEGLGGITIGFHKTLNAALRRGAYRMQDGTLFSCCEETRPQMTLAQRVEAMRALGFWIERFDSSRKSNGVEYFYFSNHMRRKYGDIMLRLRARPPRDDNGGYCNYASERFKDEEGWLRVMW